MKNKLCKYLILLVFCLNHANIFSQDIKLNIKQNSKIDSLLKKKIELDRDQFKKTYFTLQLYYGDLTLAEEVLERSKETFPHIEVELSFETPNYKVQVGNYKDYYFGMSKLREIKSTYPSAFLLEIKN